MKSPLRKLRGLANHHRSESKDKKDRRNRTPARLDDLVQATQDMLDMRSCYDSLLSAAAATANSAYEFSEALEEMGTCLLKKTALNEDEDSGRALLMLGKVQFELQKLVDSYRIHVIQTITTPSESLLKELQTVEEMKRQCDDKRELYKFMLAAHKEKGKSKHSKSETVSSKQLQEAEDDYEEEANLFVFRLKSLKQGQSRSLLIQAARHHASQLNFFRKALKSLETVEPHIKVVADREHIDYQFSGLEDDIEDDYDDDYYSYDDNDDGELSFDYGRSSDDEDSVSPGRKSMEVDQIDKSAVRASTTGLTKVNINRSHSESFDFSKRPSPVTQSAPIFPDKKFDPPEKVKELRPSLSRKLNTYVLPTPVDAKRIVSTGSISPPLSTARMNRKDEDATHLWHSSPLDPSKFYKNSRDDEFLIQKAHPATTKESNINNSSIRIPTSSSQELPLPNFNLYTHSDAKKIRRQAFSGPITRRPWSEKPNLSATDIMPSVEHPPVSTTPARVRTSGASISPRASPSISPPPRISELHELPRPPVGSTRSTRPTSLIGHSAPLVYRGQEQKKASRALPAATASPLPTPPAAVHRSFSIPSRRTPISPVAKFLDDPDNRGLAEDVASPPLTPISLTNNRPVPQASRVRS